MNALRYTLSAGFLAILGALPGLPASAQVPVDDFGEPIGDYAYSDAAQTTGEEGIPLLSTTELQDLVGPVALYPDDLLAVVLPASTFPLQLVQAQRFLDELEDDPALKPDENWDDSVVALLNYPEVLALLNEDLDWTWQLGEAVVAQHADVVSAVEGFRNRAYAAGNLHSDDRQTIREEQGAIHITPVSDNIIYVPYYEPERVVVYQPEPVIHYYPRAYPVYYYPYSSGHAFNHGYFWGVTTAFSVGWLTDRVHVIHHSYRTHPYYGRHYWNGWWYRRPSIQVHNHYYSNSRSSITRHRYTRGDAWRPRYETRRRLSNQRIVHSNYYSRTRSDGASHSARHTTRSLPANSKVRATPPRRAGTVTARTSRASPTRVEAAPRSTAQQREQRIHRSAETARSDRNVRPDRRPSSETRSAAVQAQSSRSQNRPRTERSMHSETQRRASPAARAEPDRARQQSSEQRSKRAARDNRDRPSSQRDARARDRR